MGEEKDIERLVQRRIQAAVEAEREACARIAEQKAMEALGYSTDAWLAHRKTAEAIRARGQSPADVSRQPESADA